MRRPVRPNRGRGQPHDQWWSSWLILKKWVFSSPRNTCSEVACLAERGREFQSVGAATRNDLSAILMFACGTAKLFKFSPEDLVDLIGIGCMVSWSRRYWGCPKCLTLKVTVHILNLILCSIGSQCRRSRRGAELLHRDEEVTIRARVFWMRCSFPMFSADIPYNKELQ